ncbi:hypothetical protein VNO78_25302 [Psophocarpus tetragonolobus]|uniref:(+)-neomenthol dehydrogenase-like n=1 Tax=Psophocarpus tetragonolobus TaxID=3891 RepID=A0AAN9S751_PSOTE
MVEKSCEKIRERDEVKGKVLRITIRCTSQFRLETEDGRSYTKFVRYAVVTGANKGIGLEIVRQLASAGIKVVLTSRNQQRGLQALETLKASGLSHLVLFHQLDVADATSVTSLAGFIKSKFGKLDILINNAGIGGVIIKDSDLLIKVIMSRGLST